MFKIIYSFIFLLLFISCGSDNVAGGSVEIPGGLAQGTLKDEKGQPLARAKITLVPHEKSQDSLLWIRSQTDSLGQYQIQAQEGKTYTILVRDSAKIQGIQFEVKWSVKPESIAPLKLEPLQKVVIHCDTFNANASYYGLLNTDVWKVQNLASDSLVLTDVPVGIYKLAVLESQTELLRIISQNLEVKNQEVAYSDISQVMIFAPDSVEAEEWAKPLRILGFEPVFALQDSVVFTDFAKVFVITPHVQLSNQIISQINSRQIPFLCAQSAMYSDFGMAQDTLYRTRWELGNTLVATQNRSWFDTVQKGDVLSASALASDSLAWTLVPDSTQVIMSSTTNHPVIFWKDKGLNTSALGTELKSMRVGFGVTHFQSTSELKSIYQKLIILLANQQGIP